MNSSIFPIKRERYGIVDVSDGPHEIADGLLEFPMSTVNLFGKKLPVCGGGYLRLFPLALTSRAIAELNGKRRQPALVYLHPWELDPAQPRIWAGCGNTFRHRVNLRLTEQRLAVLCKRFEFGPIREVLQL